MNTLSTARAGFGHSLIAWSRRMAGALAESRAEARLWQAARADHRVMADCLQAGGRDLDDEAGISASWGRFPEQLPDGRGSAIHLRHC